MMPDTFSSPLTLTMEAVLRHRHVRAHVPGHAGRCLLPSTQGTGLASEWFTHDVTELEGLDVLADPEGCLADAQQAYAEACQVAHTFFCTQGSTSALQAAMLACGLSEHDSVLIGRNAHRSVSSGLVLTGSMPHWCYPDWQTDWGLWQGLTVAQLPHKPPPGCKALLMTSPTYEGLAAQVSEVNANTTVGAITGIAQWCRAHKLYLIVDEAHGALWPFSHALPLSACHVAGVDAVIHSSHKTLGSLTQTAVLHLPVGSGLCPQRVNQSLHMLHTSSPSYPLLLSLDALRHHWTTPAGQAHLADWWQTLGQLRQQLAEIDELELFAPEIPSQLWDASRLVLKHTRFAHTTDWALLLEAAFNQPYEALTHNAATYVWGVGLTHSDAKRFVDAVKACCSALAHQTAPPQKPDHITTAWAHPFAIDTVCTPRTAFYAPGQWVTPTEAVGQVAQQVVVHCPPGIPVLQMGERIHPHHLPYLPQRIRVCNGRV
jgi:arginine decarboxylase